jgi:uncharacterized protein (DUF697 family)/predicted GTPase
MPVETTTDFVTTLQDAIAEALRRRGRVNVFIAGKSGVGKSTLVNAVFDRQMATTGQVRPITAETREYTKEGVPVSIIDTRGLEVGSYQAIMEDVENFIQSRNSSTDPQQHIHIGWVCVAEDSRRFEDGESKFLQMLARYMPVVVVVTKARADQGFRAEVQRLAPEARNVVRVRAISEELDEGQALQPFGLKDLVEVTMELVPEAHRAAFAAAQTIDLKHRVDQSHLIVNAAAVSAGAIGATPIPFSDALAIIPIQVGMLSGISATFGLDLNKNFLTTLLSGAAGGGFLAMAGRAIVGDLLKMIPGAGSVVGGLISGAVATTLTKAAGEAYIRALCMLMQSDSTGNITPEMVRDAFVQKLREKPAEVL